MGEGQREASVVVIGAGLAGLTCARHLHGRGIDVSILEASDDVGGRVRSDMVDGFTLDRGFQVLFDAYPAVRRNFDLQALNLQPFDPGALVCRDGQIVVLTDPLRDRRRRDVVATIGTSAIPFRDKLRVGRLVASLVARAGRGDQRAEPDHETTLAFLRRQGFSEHTIDLFFRPFFGGIFLERELETTAAAFRFYFRMLSTGQTAVPAGGMGVLSRQLAAPLLAAGRVRCDAPVAALLREGERVTGVRLEDGSEVRARSVVLATDAPAAARLAGLETPPGARKEAVVYFAGSRPLYHGRKIVLNAAADAFCNNVQLLSNVAPAYAPPGRYLLSAVVLGMPDVDDRELVGRVMRDLRRMFATDPAALAALQTYYPLRIYRIHYAQFPQPAGVLGRLLTNRTQQPGLYAAAEWTESSSINGAITSGEQCAAIVAEDLAGVRAGTG